MADWKTSAKKSLENREKHYTNEKTEVRDIPAPVSRRNDSKADWRTQAANSLKSRGYVPGSSENSSYELKSGAGKSFGTVSYGAYQAAKNHTLDDYKPKDDREKAIIDNYKDYYRGLKKSTANESKGEAKQTESAESTAPKNAFSTIMGGLKKAAVDSGKETEQGFEDSLKSVSRRHKDGEKSSVDDSKANIAVLSKGLFGDNPEAKTNDTEKANPSEVFRRYNIDPDSFGFEEYSRWLTEHHFSHGTIDHGETPMYEDGWKFWKPLPSQQEIEDQKALKAYVSNKIRMEGSTKDYGGGVAALAGAADGATMGGFSALGDSLAKAQYEKSGFDSKDFVSFDQALSETLNRHKTANIAGNVAGSIVSMQGLTKAVGSATKGIKWISKCPKWVRNAINSGITFSISSGAETAFDGGNFDDVAKSAAINLVGGSVGGATSEIVGNIGEKILFNKNWQHKIIPEIVRNATSSATFAGSKTASTYFLYDEDHRPTAEQMAKDVGIAFAFGAISSGISILETSSQNKKYLDDLYQKMAADYEKMARISVNGKTDAESMAKFAKNVVGYGNIMEAYLTGKEYSATVDGKTYTFTPNKVRLVGQDKYVQSILSDIQTIRNNANATLNGTEAPFESTAVVTNMQPSNAANSNFPATPQQSKASGTNDDIELIVPKTFSETNTKKSPTISPSAELKQDTPESQSVAPERTNPENATISQRQGSESDSEIDGGVRNASDEIQRTVSVLDSKGANEQTKARTAMSASRIEYELQDTALSVRDVLYDMTSATSAAVSEMNKSVGKVNSEIYWDLVSRGLEMLGNTDENNDIDVTSYSTDSYDLPAFETISAYAEAYADSLRGNNPEKYKEVFVSKSGEDISDKLAESVIRGNVPSEAKNAVKFSDAMNTVKRVAKNVYDAVQTTSAKIEEAKSAKPNAGADTSPNASAKQSIRLTRVGDFYEAYGEDAKRISDKLGLTLTSKTVNGERVPMAGFPVTALENYRSALGSDYEVLTESDPAVDTNAQSSGSVSDSSPLHDDIYKKLDDLGLTDDEQRAILDYKSGGSYLINAFLRSGNPSDDQIQFADTINKALDKFPPYAGIAYRNIGFESKEDWDQFLSEHHENAIKAYSGFISASKDIDGYPVNSPYTAHYEIISHGAKDVSGFGIREEDEVLFKTGTGFFMKSIKVSENSVSIQCEEVAENGVQRLSPVNGEARKEESGNGNAAQKNNIRKNAESIERPDRIRGGRERVDGLSETESSGVGDGYSERIAANNTGLRSEHRDVDKHEGVVQHEGVEEVAENSDRAGGTDNLPKVFSQDENGEIRFKQLGVDVIPYTDAEIRNWQNSNTIIVYENDKQFEAFVEKVLNNEDTEKKVYFGKIPNATAQMVLEKTGVDVTGHNIALKGYEIRKILLNSHGNEKAESARGQEVITVDDLKRVPDVVSNPDNVILSSKEYEGKPTLLFEKNIDGNNYIVSYVSKKHHDIAVQTMYKKRSLSVAEDANAFSFTSETTNSTASNIIVPQKEQDVNNSVRQSSKLNTSKLTEKCDLIATKHTKTGDDLWVVTLGEKISSDAYADLNKKVKAVGGYYSRFAKAADGSPAPGFVFKSEPSEEVIKVFNDFFEPKTEKTSKEDTNNVSRSEVLAGESGSDGGGLHSGTVGTAVKEGTEGSDRPDRTDGGEGLPRPSGDETSRRDGGIDSARIHGGNDGGAAVQQTEGASRGDGRGRRGELLGGRDGSVSGLGEHAEQLTNRTEEAPETIETGAKTLEKKRPSNKNNFVITNDVAREFNDTAPSAEDNIHAIELLRKIEDEGRSATDDEKRILAKYKGWGGVDTRYMPYTLRYRFEKLFDYEQRRAMQSSQNNAFFTPTDVIDAMYNGLIRMGFKGGNVLESSMGTGNFFGRMPLAISAKSALTGVELESYTARIAQLLYPGATVINKPFQDVAIRNGSYDLVIGNVPFGQNKISYNKKKYALHNYFILSSLDKVKDGGIVAVITSAGTLDSHGIDARKAIMDKADVVACYKLPEKIFSRNAKTDVQADLLILRKRADGAKPSGDSILNTTETSDGLRLNEYFVKHPENILGKLAKGSNAWGDITTVINDGSFYDKLNAAMQKLPKGLISGKTDLKPIETIVSVSEKPRFFEKNGAIYSDDGAGTATKISPKQEQIARDYMQVRDAYKQMLDAYDRDLPESEIKPLRDALSEVYDDFCQKHSAISGDGKKKVDGKRSKNNSFLEADSDYYLVSGLERYDPKAQKFEKSALFEKDTLRKKKVSKVDSSSEALAVSLNETGKIDFPRMEELTGKSESELAEELKGEIVLTPEGDYVLRDIYLSGNIYEKLDAVKDKPAFKEQREMLEKVIPTPKDASEIMVKLGANYIDESYVEQFAHEVLNTRITIRKDLSGRWIIDGVRQSRYGDVVNVKYGCDAFNAIQLLEKILNDSDITATNKVRENGKETTVYDAEMTDVARQKADDIRSAFESWVFKDGDRRTKIVEKYNRMYNHYRPLHYDRIAEKLTFDSMESSLRSKLYPHQRKGIARFLFGGNILFAHGVGTGKTYEMVASVMEAKRMGLINKAAMVVPNNKVVDFKRDITQLYPNAKVLVIDTANKKRQTMLGLVNSNDWDIVLIARTTFTKIPVSRELQAHFASEQLEQIERQISEAEGDRNVTRRQMKGLITQRDNYEQKLKDLNAETKRDENSVDFERLGIDCICADEAHNYKSIMTPTKLDIKGLVNRNNAQIANDMLMKLDYLRSVGGKIIFGTGTPITNTVSEIYNMMRMVRPDILEDADIHSLDEWINTFAKIDTVTEIGIDNQIKAKSTQVIRSFVNVSEMVGMFRQFADVVFTKDVVKDLPKAKYIDIEIDGTPEHKQIEENISTTLAKAPRKDLLKIHGQLMAMADVAAVDLRMLSGAESAYNPFKSRSKSELEYENSKINTMCNVVYDEYQKSSDIKGTQIIFCDKGSGSGTVYSFNLHKDIMQKLIDRGIPKGEIVIIKDQNDAQLEALYEKVNNGEVRVLIGTSQKMAEGLNVQKRVVAIHHPTVTYKPSDKEQGDARGVRSGNINSEVRIYRYLQKNTFDSHKWQAQDRKSEMINRALRGDVISEMEDIGADDEGGAGVDAATAMAITSGNPLVKEKIDIDKEVSRLKTLQRNYLSERYRYEDAISKNPGMIRQLSLYAENLTKDIALRNQQESRNSVVIGNKTFEKTADANKALVEAIKKAPKNGKFTTLGTFKGFDITFKGDTGGMDYVLALKGSGTYSVEYAAEGNNIARFSGVLNRLDSELIRTKEQIGTLTDDLAFAKKEVAKPFEKEKELNEALAKQKDVTYRYEHYNERFNNPDEASTSEKTDAVKIHSSREVQSNDIASKWTTQREAGKKERNVSIHDIVREISKKFDIPISTGKVTDSKAAGIYKDVPETIRTRVTDNLPVISHELGHHLDKLYNLTDSAYIDALRGAVSQEFLDQYPPERKNSEAVAEFLRTYLKSRSEAERLCPDFYSDFERKLLKDDLDSVNEIADAVNEYLSYGASKRYDAAITSSKAKPRRSLKEWLKETFDNGYTYWVDAFHPIKNVMDYVEETTLRTPQGKKNAYILATNSMSAHATSNFLICEGFRDLDGNVLNENSFLECLDGVDAKDANLLDKYLVLRHSLEWIEPKQEGMSPKRVFADETLENPDTIRQEMDNIEKEHPEIKTAAEKLYEYQQNVLLHFAVPSGLISEDTLNALNEKYPSYVPFYRSVGNSKSGFAKGTFANQRSPIMRAKGSGAAIISPLESIIRNTEKVVKASLRNQVMSTLSYYADTVNGFGKYMEKVPPDMLPHFTDISKMKKKFNDALQQIVETGDDYFAVSGLLDEVFGDSVADFTPVANAKKRIVTVLKDGKSTYYQIHDEAFFKSVAELTPKQLSGFLKMSHDIMQPMKLLITQRNPIFAVSNALRDFDAAYTLSETVNPVTFAKQYARAFSEIIRKRRRLNSKSYKQYKALGGGHGSELSASIESISSALRRVAQKDEGKARRLAYAIFVHPLETIANLNDAVENIPRFAEFQRTLEAGGDLQTAIYNANDITTNYRKSGSGDSAKAANNTVMYNNANIQGVDKLFRTFFNKSPIIRRKAWTKAVIKALLGSLIAYGFNRLVDKEGYENLSSYKKNNYYNYAIGDGHFISIPKARENAVANSFAERVIESLGGNEEAFYDFGGYVADQFLPPMIPDSLNPVDALHSVAGSTIFGGIADIGFNKDFKGSPIESGYDKYLPSNERYSDNTSKLAYALGQTKIARAADMSPKKIDHLISSYTGILGQVNKALFPVNKDNVDYSVGLRNKFISDSNYSTDVLNKIYDNAEKAQRQFEYDRTIESAVEYEQNAIIKAYVSEMNKAVNALPKSEHRNGRKYLLQSLNSWNYETTKSQKMMTERLDGITVDKDCIITGLPGSKLEWSEGKIRYTYQMTPQEYNRYTGDYLKLVDNYRLSVSRSGLKESEYTTALSKSSAQAKELLNKKYKAETKAKAEKQRKN